MIPILIGNRDLLRSVQEQVRFFQQIPDAYIVLCDSASTYPPLLEWYNHIKLYFGFEKIACGEGVHPRERWKMDPIIATGAFVIPHELILFPDNRGPRACQSIQHELSPHDYYFLSDSDMDYTGISPDFLEDLQLALDTCPEVEGVGVSIRLDDLPQTPMADYARHVEKGNWSNENLTACAPKEHPRHLAYFYRAPCDTAGVLRRMTPGWTGGYAGLRSVTHVARHTPWYFIPENMPEDFKWFYDKAETRGTCYTARVLDRSRPL